jgi:murein L,D-transpeptidase YafK
VPQATDGHPLPEVLVDPTVVIDKSARRVTVFSEGTPVKGYRAALGRVPEGAKEREGDGKTPEGVFYVCTKNAASKYHRALGLSYPSEKDADRGLASDLISKREHRAIVTALHRMQQPPWKTALGGEIMIHGSGSGRGDWTLGCIALDDDDIEELFTALPMGTPVEIRP